MFRRLVGRKPFESRDVRMKLFGNGIRKTQLTFVVDLAGILVGENQLRTAIGGQEKSIRILRLLVRLRFGCWRSASPFGSPF